MLKEMRNRSVKETFAMFFWMSLIGLILIAAMLKTPLSIIIAETLTLKPNQIEYVEYVIICFGAFMILFGSFFFLKAIFGGYHRKAVNYIKNKGEGELEKAKQDYSTAITLCQDVKIGRYFIFSKQPKNCLIIPKEEILWAYIHKKVKKYFFFIRICTLYYVFIRTDDGNCYKFYSKNERDANIAIDKMQELCPGISTGYSAKLKDMYFNDRRKMINHRTEIQNEMKRPAEKRWGNGYIS